MSATSGAVVGAVAASQAAQNNRIEKQRCKLVLENYEPQYAETKGMKDYAYCVQKLYPDPMNNTEVGFAKAGVLILLIAFVIGIIYGYIRYKKQSFLGLGEIAFWAFMIPAGAFICMFVVLLIVAGVGFLFT